MKTSIAANFFLNFCALPPGPVRSCWLTIAWVMEKKSRPLRYDIIRSGTGYLVHTRSGTRRQQPNGPSFHHPGTTFTYVCTGTLRTSHGPYLVPGTYIRYRVQRSLRVVCRGSWRAQKMMQPTFPIATALIKLEPIPVLRK